MSFFTVIRAQSSIAVKQKKIDGFGGEALAWLNVCNVMPSLQRALKRWAFNFS